MMGMAKGIKRYKARIQRLPIFKNISWIGEVPYWYSGYEKCGV